MRTIGCDEVFETLTRPAGHDHRNDHASMVIEHLQSCDECRKLDESLRPVVSFLSLSSSAGEPGFSLEADEETSVAAIMQQINVAATETETDGEVPASNARTTAPTTAPLSEASRPSSLIAKLRLSPLVAIGCLAVAVMAMLVVLQPNAKISGAAMANDAERFDYLLSSGVPVVCLANVGWSHCSAIEHSVATGAKLVQSDDGEKRHQAENDCATCHQSPPDENRPANGFPPLANTCVVCHMQSDKGETQHPAGTECCTACHDSHQNEDHPAPGFQPLADSCLICHMDK